MQPIPKWEGRRADRAREQVRKQGYKNQTPCCICDQPINYTLPSTDPDGMSVQHIKPRSVYPHLTWEPTNWAPAHLQCNKQAGVHQVYELGTTSRQWG